MTMTAYRRRMQTPGGMRAGGWGGSRAAFTLVELLVVMAIISVLAAMLLPALKNAREAAKTLRCLSNVKQISLGMSEYAGDASGYLPMVGYASAMNNWWSQPTSNPWSKVLIDGGYVGGKSSEFLTTKGHMLFCEADKSSYGGGSWQLKRSFGIGLACVWNGSVYTSAKAGALKRPSITMTLAESYGTYNFLRGESCLAYYTVPSGTMYASYGHADGRGNYAFGDGHAATVPQGATSGIKFDNY